MRRLRRRLRMAGGDDVLGRRQRAERIRARRAPADRLHGLGEHVIRERVVGDRVADGQVQRAVARRVPQPQAGGGVEAHPLGVHSDPGVPLLKQVLVRLEPVDLLVPLIGHVGPLGDHDAVELGRVRGAADDDARLVRVAGVEHRGRVGAGDRVAAGLPGDEVLLLDVARLGEVHVGGQERVAVRRDRRAPRCWRPGRSPRARERSPRSRSTRAASRRSGRAGRLRPARPSPSALRAAR